MKRWGTDKDQNVSRLKISYELPVEKAKILCVGSEEPMKPLRLPHKNYVE
jgi:hypothetical protein